MGETENEGKRKEDGRDDSREEGREELSERVGVHSPLLGIRTGTLSTRSQVSAPNERCDGYRGPWRDVKGGKR
ncbi:hypothetical protein EAI_05778 [Harpegnathos saltator]|uniref:Uncharacterized protein n=1 Tax=Harpegnathos saltator TaxID=610380 RepID=E2BUP6_HARSA|nr:hypothetical protein EAI_05778 [Harpegnathos saltator]